MPPTLKIAENTHASKYRLAGESFDESQTRISSALSDNDKHFHALRDITIEQRFLFAGRIQAAAGSSKNVTCYNCFVSGTIEDNFVTGIGKGAFFKEGGIMARVAEAAQTMRMGGGIGFDFSTLRPKRDIIRSLESGASGPVSFMPIYDAACKATMSAGHRRGAMMAVLRVDHPDIEEYLHVKQNSTNLTGFNTSIALTDEFMRAVKNGKDFNLRWMDLKQGLTTPKVYKTIDARALWEQIMRATFNWAEPGVLFIDRINEMNNLYYCEYIAATNPCAEQPLPPYGACLLGSFNLTKYIIEGKGTNKFRFNWNQFKKDIPIIVRAMDNVIDVSKYPLIEQRREALSKRRMGLGVTGLSNAIEALGFSYGSRGFITQENKILSTLKELAYRASADLAVEKETFPFYDKTKYMNSKFIKTLSLETQKYIAKRGMRNSHLTSIAPTGTISLTANNVSSGIEPVFTYEYDRTVIDVDGPIVERITDYGFREFGKKGKTTIQCTIDDHLAVLLTAQKHMDSAVSKTCNINPMMPWEDFKNIYIRAWRGGAKGCTTFNPEGKRMGILIASDESSEDGEACFINADGSKSCE